MSRPTQEQELAEEIVARWTESHKKSMLTFIALIGLTHQSMWSKQLETWLHEVTGWEVTERGLHRLLQRMNNLNLIDHRTQASAKSGADRKVYSATEFGRSVASMITTSGLSYLQSPQLVALLPGTPHCTASQAQQRQ